jgi:hypothetical protein
VNDVELGRTNLSVASCIGKLKVKEEFGHVIDEEVDFIASHFYEVDTKELKDIRHEAIERLVSHENLRLADEESLLEFITFLGEDYCDLLGYVECLFLTSEAVETFLERIQGREMDERVWTSLCRRLRCDISKLGMKSTSPRFAVTQNYVEGQPLQGIIHKLTAICGGNVHDHGLVAVTTSGSSSGNPGCVLNPDNANPWTSVNTANSWICFDFKHRKIALSHYTVKPGSFRMGPWAVEGSVDGTNWTILDQRTGANMRIFECSKESSSKFFRFIRLRQTGENGSNNAQDNERLSLTAMEFFGTV